LAFFAFGAVSFASASVCVLFALPFFAAVSVPSGVSFLLLLAVWLFSFFTLFVFFAAGSVSPASSSVFPVSAFFAFGLFSLEAVSFLFASAWVFFSLPSGSCSAPGPLLVASSAWRASLVFASVPRGLASVFVALLSSFVARSVSASVA